MLTAAVLILVVLPVLYEVVHRRTASTRTVEAE
jgi:cobalt-zinc-cadmium resistance protein CzcA